MGDFAKIYNELLLDKEKRERINNFLKMDKVELKKMVEEHPQLPSSNYKKIRNKINKES